MTNNRRTVCLPFKTCSMAQVTTTISARTTPLAVKTLVHFILLIAIQSPILSRLLATRQACNPQAFRPHLGTRNPHPPAVNASLDPLKRLSKRFPGDARNCFRRLFTMVVRIRPSRLHPRVRYLPVIFPIPLDRTLNHKRSMNRHHRVPSSQIHSTAQLTCTHRHFLPTDVK